MEIIVTSGPDTGVRATLTSALTIGRASANDLILPSSLVSSQHAIIRLLPDGAVELTDLSSRNGTLVDGVRINRPTRVESGAVIQLGDDVLSMRGRHDAAMVSEHLRQPAASVSGGLLRRRRPEPSIAAGGSAAGRDINLSGGHAAAGRDVHYTHNDRSLRIRTRMSPTGRRMLKLGFFVTVIGLAIAFGGFAIYGQELFGTVLDGFERQNSDRFEPLDMNTGQLALGLGLLGIGSVVCVIGVVMMLISLFMRRDPIRDPR